VVPRLRFLLAVLAVTSATAGVAVALTVDIRADAQDLLDLTPAETEVALKKARVTPVRIYRTRECSRCDEAAVWLSSHGIAFQSRYVDGDDASARALHRMSEKNVVPTLLVGGAVLQGFSVNQFLWAMPPDPARSPLTSNPSWVPIGLGIGTESLREAGRTGGFDAFSAESAFEWLGVAGHPLHNRARLDGIGRELLRYAPGFLRGLGLKRLVVCDDLRSQERPTPALSDPITGTLFVAADDASGRHALHHELAHLWDTTANRTRDPEWEALNEVELEYVIDALHGHSPETLPPPRTGFASPQAQLSASEDRAETYAYLLFDPVTLFERARGDAVLSAKIARMQQDIQATDPAMKAILSGPTRP
jgi:glutaredoxin